MSIEIKHLSKAFGDKVVLRDVSLTVDPGEVLFIIGTSGTGKSVLMRHVVGLLKPDAGEVWLDGLRVDDRSERALYEVRRRCGFVFQHPTLLDFLTLEENVALPLVKRRGLKRAAARAAARTWLSRVGIEAAAGRRPGALGAGVQKRAAIARALALEPAYLVYDEPTTGLDPRSARQVDRVIRDLADHTRVTSIVVSHDLTSIFGIADRVVLLYQGGIRAQGPPAAFRESRDGVVRQFVAGRAEGPMRV